MDVKIELFRGALRAQIMEDMGTSFPKDDFGIVFDIMAEVLDEGNALP
jgi:hypothetical protein